MTWVAAAAIAFMVLMGTRQLRRANRERFAVLSREVGHQVSLVTVQGKAFKLPSFGNLRSVDRRNVVLEAHDEQVVVPLGAIQQAWRGKTCLGEW